MTELQGLLPPVVTPMRDGKVDTASIHRLVDFLVEPLDGICICSSTGEAASLSPGERRLVVSEFSRAIADRSPLVVGLTETQAPNLTDFLNFCEEQPIAAYLVPVPFYFRHTDSSVLDWFAFVSSLTSRPLVIYDNPYSTKFTLSPSLIARLASDNPGVRYVKLTDIDINKPPALAELSSITMLAGSDDVMQHQLVRGCQGVICATPQVLPAESRDWYDAVVAGDERRAAAARLKLLPFVGEVLVGVDEYPAVVKHALWKRNVIASPEVRRPLSPLSPLRQREVDLSIREVLEGVAR